MWAENDNLNVNTIVISYDLYVQVCKHRKEAEKRAITDLEACFQKRPKKEGLVIQQSFKICFYFGP